jgi:hypothetical protein
LGKLKGNDISKDLGVDGSILLSVNLGEIGREDVDWSDEKYNVFVGKHEGKKHSEDLGIDGRIILDWILGK